MHTILIDVEIFLPVILKICMLIALLYIPVPIVLFIYRRRKDKPDNNFAADGNFQGFKITASGSVALYFILFVACLSASIPIMSSIDRTQSEVETISKLHFSMDSILVHSPWKLKYSIQLMTDDTTIINNEAYGTYLNSQHFHPFPPAIDMDPNTHVITCYMDNDLFESNNNNYTVNIDNFSSSFELHIDSTQKKASTRTIDLGNIHIVQFSPKKVPYTQQATLVRSLSKTQLPIEPQLNAIR
jgi:hypothetical protein